LSARYSCYFSSVADDWVKLAAIFFLNEKWRVAVTQLPLKLVDKKRDASLFQSQKTINKSSLINKKGD
jgi:hypothetical protein